jgi:transcriptional regulator with XRE-family HTH domain
MVDSLFTAAADAIAAAVVDLRRRRQMTQRDLAQAIGREQNYIARIETCQRRVDIVEWIKLCQACGTDPAKETARLLRVLLPLVPRR